MAWGTASRTKFAQQTPGGLQYFLPDALGSTLQLTDAAGVPILAQSFDLYGDRLSSLGIAATGESQWATNPSKM